MERCCIQLNKCKFCGSEPRWCGQDNKNPEDDHDCHQIHCDSCGVQFDVDCDSTNIPETLEGVREYVAMIWNRV